MRTPKLVKHTFKDFGSGSKIEVVEEVSSLSKVKLEKQTKAAEPVAEQSSPPQMAAAEQAHAAKEDPT